MSTCLVLRCQLPPTAIFTLLDEPLMQGQVCAEHQSELQDGANWMLDADSGLLMGDDIPPKVVGYSISDLLSGEQGLCLNLELETAGGPKSRSVWLSTDEADKLGEFLTTRFIR